MLSLILADHRHQLLQDTDCAKDGEHQQQEHHDDVLDYEHVSDFAPFFEIDAHWDPNDDSLAVDVRRNHEKLNQRVFNTHLRWEMLPKQQEQENNSEQSESLIPDNDEKESLRPACGKFIYVTRNLTDVCTSFYHHLSNQKEGTYTEGFDRFAIDWMAGKIPFGSPLHHLLSFAEGFSDNQYSSYPSSLSHTNKQNNDGVSVQQQQRPLLLVSYEKMKANLRQEVLRIIDFLDLTHISMDVLDNEILPTFDFRSMKVNSHKFQPKSVTWLNGYQFLRKGASGDGKSMFRETVNGDGIPLMDIFRDWVTGEEYCEGVSSLELNAGLDKGTAATFRALVDNM